MQGYTELETYQFLSKCLDIKVEEIKNIPQIKKLRDIWDGHPYLLSVMGSHIKAHRDDLLSNPSHWDNIFNFTNMDSIKLVALILHKITVITNFYVNCI